jgi:hypothetical protein
MMDVITIQQFFRKSWCYMDTYRCVTFTDCLSSLVLTYHDRKGLNLQQVVFATRIYKQHCRVGTVAEVLNAMRLQGEHNKALANL